MEEILEHLSMISSLMVLNEKKEIVAAVAGHPIDAHREGCRILDEIYKQPIETLADIVIASPVAFPKDLNVYQTQKLWIMLNGPSKRRYYHFGWGM